MPGKKDPIRNLYDLRADGTVRCPLCRQTRTVGGLTRARDRRSRRIVTIVVCEECGIGLHAKTLGLSEQEVREQRAAMLSMLTMTQDERISGELARLRAQAARSAGVQETERPIEGPGLSPGV
jgi:hypothetical protein